MLSVGNIVGIGVVRPPFGKPEKVFGRTTRGGSEGSFKNNIETGRAYELKKAEDSSSP